MRKYSVKIMSCITVSVITLLSMTGLWSQAVDEINDSRTAVIKQQIFALPAEQYNILNDLAISNGYASIYSLVDASNTRSVTTVDQSRIKDLDDSGNIDITDAIALARFLDGDFLYAYSYEELDVTGDYLLDDNDVTAYIQYLSAHNTFSAHGSVQLPDLNFEHRSYTKHDYSTNTTSTYTLQDSTMLSSISARTEALAHRPNTFDNISNDTELRDESDLPSTCDDRIVRIGEELTPNDRHYLGSGFIVDSHVIATAAHCVYNRNAVDSMKFNPHRTVYAFTYQQNADGTYNEVPHKLHIQYVAVPSDYISCSNTDVKWWDYGMIVVEEDLLEDYHAFSLGVVIEGAARSKYDEPGAFDTTVVGFYSGSIVLPRYLTGTLYDYNDYRMTVESTIPYGGSSGCAVYCDDGNLDVAIGIIQSTGKHGMVISRPLLEFYLHP